MEVNKVIEVRSADRFILTSSLHNDTEMINLPVNAVVFATRTVAADRTQMFAARQGVIRRIRRDRFALAAGRCTQEVAVTTSIEGSLHAKQRTIVYEIYAATTVACTFRNTLC